MGIDLTAPPVVYPHDPKTAYTDDPRRFGSTRVFGANLAVGARVNMPETGTINALAVWIVVQNGNVDCGIYDTTATTRNRLVSIGSTASAAAGAWQVFTVSLAVKAGDAVDFAFATDSASCSIGAGVSSVNSGSTLPSGWVTVPLGGAPKLAWSIAASFPLPTTLTEASLAGASSGYFPLIIARYA